MILHILFQAFHQLKHKYMNDVKPKLLLSFLHSKIEGNCGEFLKMI